MSELIPENRCALNQRTKALLKAAEADADPTSLYVLQLMRWRLDSGESAIRESLRPDLSHALEVLEASPHDHAIEVLTKAPHDPDKSGWVLHPSDLDGLSPSDAADLLLDNLEFQRRSLVMNVDPAPAQ